MAEQTAALAEVTDSPVFALSGTSGEGVPAVLHALADCVAAARAEDPEAAAPETDAADDAPEAETTSEAWSPLD